MKCDLSLPLSVFFGLPDVYLDFETPPQRSASGITWGNPMKISFPKEGSLEPPLPPFLVGPSIPMWGWWLLGKPLPVECNPFNQRESKQMFSFSIAWPLLSLIEPTRCDTPWEAPSSF